MRWSPAVLFLCKSSTSWKVDGLTDGNGNGNEAGTLDFAEKLWISLQNKQKQGFLLIASELIQLSGVSRWQRCKNKGTASRGGARRGRDWGLKMADVPNNLFTAGRTRSAPIDGAPPTGIHHVRSATHSGLTPARQKQSNAQRQAAARLAQVMASSVETDDYDEELQFERQPMPSYVGSRDSSPRVMRSNFGVSRDPSPRVMRTLNDSVPPAPTLIGRPAVPVVKPLVPMHRTKFPPRVTNDPPVDSSQRRPSIDMGFDPPMRSNAAAPVRSNGARPDTERMEEAALRDEIDILEEDKEILEKKLQDAEELLMQREARMKELEKQVAHLGEGISLEARLISRKEAALRQREAALKAQKEQAKDNKDDEIAALQLEANTLKEEAQSAIERAEVAEKEARGLRSVTHRMILTREEQVEVRMKRCWLARYWGLAAKYQVYQEVASTKFEQWSKVAPVPNEYVISAGHFDETSSAPGQKKTTSIRDLNDLTIDEGNIEGMLAVEKGLRELASLNVEQAVMLAMSENQHPLGTVRGELTAEEKEDLKFKHAWLVYFWRRAKNYKVEKAIAEDRLTYWIAQSDKPHPTSHDVVDVERGLLELQMLGIEEQLWEASRKEIASGRLFEDLE
ncbi:hypothetical protein R1flu_016933 [Riccia fluitans]|uniref:Ripening-regulated protein n=1 Tax=Riccia fluitans TaxID=41844 RepID=A0ABD1YR99_9MARC